jgi:hypothetical protein
MLFRRPPSDIPTLSLVDTLDDDGLFAGQFSDASWMPWRIVLAALEGRALDAQGLDLYRRCTARQTPPTEPVRELVCIVGRRGGKSRIGALLAVEAACLRDWTPFLAAGEVATVAVIAADRAQARTTFGYIAGLLDAVPMLGQRVTRRRAHAIELGRRVRIEVTTASARTTRGYTFAAVIADELAFWSSENSVEPDVEVLAAVRPGMTTLPGSRLVCISSPYARRGALWEAFKSHYAKDGDPVLVWKANSLMMNPAVDQAAVDAAYARDPASASAEYGAEFRTDVEAFLSRELLDAVVVPGRTALPPLSSTSYVAFVDPSGGAQDAMTLAIAHAEKVDGHLVAVLDLVAARTPPFSPESVVREFAKLLKSYGVGCVTGDRYSGEWCREAFSRHGVAYVVAEQTKSQLYAELLPLITSQRVALLDHPKLLQEALGLERRTARGGRDSIDHGPHQHDDLANAAAGACVLAVAGGEVVIGVNPDPQEWPLRRAMRLGVYLGELGDEENGTHLVQPGDGPDSFLPLPRPR